MGPRQEQNGPRFCLSFPSFQVKPTEERRLGGELWQLSYTAPLVSRIAGTPEPWPWEGKTQGAELHCQLRGAQK